MLYFNKSNQLLKISSTVYKLKLKIKIQYVLAFNAPVQNISRQYINFDVCNVGRFNNAVGMSPGSLFGFQEFF